MVEQIYERTDGRLDRRLQRNSLCTKGDCFLWDQQQRQCKGTAAANFACRRCFLLFTLLLAPAPITPPTPSSSPSVPPTIFPFWS